MPPSMTYSARCYFFLTLSVALLLLSSYEVRNSRLIHNADELTEAIISDWPGETITLANETYHNIKINSAGNSTVDIPTLPMLIIECCTFKKADRDKRNGVASLRGVQFTNNLMVGESMAIIDGCVKLLDMTLISLIQPSPNPKGENLSFLLPKKS